MASATDCDLDARGLEMIELFKGMSTYREETPLDVRAQRLDRIAAENPGLKSAGMAIMELFLMGPEASTKYLPKVEL